jgi:hypothetical protein
MDGKPHDGGRGKAKTTPSLTIWSQFPATADSRELGNPPDALLGYSGVHPADFRLRALALPA